MFTKARASLIFKRRGGLNLRWVIFCLAILAVSSAFAGIPEYPQFELFSIDGGRHISRELRGKAVLIPFFARVCPPCKAEVPFINELHRKYPDILAVLSIAFLETDLARLLALISEWRIKYPVCPDPDGRVAGAFTVYVFPHLILIDHRGKFVKNYAGLDARNNRDLVKKIEALRTPIEEYRASGPSFFIETIEETDQGVKGLGKVWRDKISSWIKKEGIAIAASMQESDYVIEGNVSKTADDVEVEIIVKSRAGAVETKFSKKVARGKESEVRSLLLKQLEIFPYLGGKK